MNFYECCDLTKKVYLRKVQVVVKSKSDPKKEEKLDHNEMSKHVPATA